MKGLEGVSDSDFHGWTVPRYGADAKESGGVASRTSPSVGHGIDICGGGGKTELLYFIVLPFARVKKFALTHTFMKDAEARQSWSHGSYHALGRLILRSPGAE